MIKVTDIFDLILMQAIAGDEADVHIGKEWLGGMRGGLWRAGRVCHVGRPVDLLLDSSEHLKGYSTGIVRGNAG